MIQRLLDELASGPEPDPMGAARLAMRPSLPNRFYKDVGLAERDGAFVVQLDGRTAKTPARHDLALPSRSLAEAVAAEWAAQGERIDPASMPLTRLVNVAVDRVAGQSAAVAAEIVKYAGADLLCYRAEKPEGLVAVQAAAWDPVIDWARTELGASFALARDVRFVEQPQETIARVRAELEKFSSPFALAGLASATALLGSVLLALALARGWISVEEAWTAAHLDEDWNIAHWGEDAEAKRRRTARFAEFKAAARLLMRSE